MNRKKYKIIIDTDPGIDDAMALAFFMKRSDIFDIKLLSVSGANIGVEGCLKNALHLLKKFNRTDIPIVMGANKPIKGRGHEAKEVHGQMGLGGYVFDDVPNIKKVRKNFEDTIYNIIKNEQDIIFIELGGNTTLAKLFLKYDDAKHYISRIICEGGSGYGQFGNAPYISFNASYDAVATKIVYDSGVPITLVTSEVGRWKTCFTKSNLNAIVKAGAVGEFFGVMLSEYLTTYTTKNIVQNNDLNVVMYMMYPRLYKTMKAKVEVETEGDLAGKMTFVPNTHAKTTIIYDVFDKNEFFDKFMTELKKLTF